MIIEKILNMEALIINAEIIYLVGFFGIILEILKLQIDEEVKI